LIKIGNYTELNPKPSLVILSPGFPENEQETDNIPALQLFLKELNRRNEFIISIISLHYPYQAKSYLWFGMKVFALGGKNKKGLSRVLRLMQCMSIANQIHREEPIDHIHSFWMGEAAWIGNRIAKKLNIPHSCTLMGQDALGKNIYFKRVKRLPKLVALSNFHQQKLIQHYQVEADEVIPWGLENTFLQPQPKTIDILGVGNFISIKNFSSFIRIVHELSKTKAEIKAVLIGRGNEEKKLQTKIRNLGLNENIRIIPQMYRDEVLSYMAQSKCFLHCSDYESFGMVIIEALANGAWVLSKKVGIAEEIPEVECFETEEQAVKMLIDFLNKDHQTNLKKMPFTIKNTVDLYLKKVYLKE